MRRRAFLAWLIGLALWPRRAATQPVGTWRVLSRPDPAVPAARPTDLLLPTQAAARAQAAIERARPGIARVSVHFCPHAAGEPASAWWNCRDDVRAQYEEV